MKGEGDSAWRGAGADFKVVGGSEGDELVFDDEREFHLDRAISLLGAAAVEKVAALNDAIRKGEPFVGALAADAAEWLNLLGVVDVTGPVLIAECERECGCRAGAAKD